MKDARSVAAEALMRQEKNGYANLVLKSVLAQWKASAQEKALAAAVFYGTVERMATIDWILQQFLAKPLERADPSVRAVLRSGLYQGRWMDSVPVHTAVDESVKLCKRMGKGSAAGLVNAVLRKAVVYDMQQAVFPGEAQRLAVTYSVSRPMAEFLLQKLPEDAEAFLRASFEKPEFCVRVNPLKTDTETLQNVFQEQGMACRKGQVEGALLVDWRGSLTECEAFRQGWFHVQGQSSQLACAALDAGPHQKVVDLCAAPGGKSALLAQNMNNTGKLFCRDVSESRTKLIEETLERLGVTNAQVKAADAAVWDEALADADRVLCDVPCSGLGTLAKKPDVRYKSLEGMDELIAVQKKILETGARYVKPGGILVYSTCTVNPDENQHVVADFLSRHSDFELQMFDVPQWARRTPQGVLVCPPCRQADGFFIAKLQKRVPQMR